MHHIETPSAWPKKSSASAFFIFLEETLNTYVTWAKHYPQNNDDRDDHVADDQLPEREIEHVSVAPVLGVVKRHGEMRLPYPDDPDMSEHEPDGQEDVKSYICHARHG